ncbi:MAG TPA: hypothetical protein VGR34_01385 [Candidatus Dormibacteraeota bacterium]|nr:hypothetical protein [Candidatus Dormibacteraeota bacterium]
MKTESAAYTKTDFENFLNVELDSERKQLADRLERASARLAKVGPRIKAGGGDDDEWNGHEILAHIAGFSKYYGVMVHKVATGQVTDVDLMASTNIRDESIVQMSAMEPADLLRMALDAHARTAKELRTLDLAAFRNKAVVEGGVWFSPVGPDFLARYPLVNHLEAHVEQLEKLLG